VRQLVLRAVLAATVGVAEFAEAQVELKFFVNCADWVTLRKQDAAPYEGLLVGVLNGLSIGRNTEFWERPGQAISAEQSFLWMDNFCQANPLKSIFDGAYRLFNEVTSQ